MSKRKSPKKKNINKKVQKKKPVNKKKLVITSIICGVMVLAGITVAVVFGCINAVSSARIEKLCEWDWHPVSATDASGDQANLQDIYSVNYESYQGALSFFDDGEFTFWLSPGDSSDGTHSGKYEYNQDDTIDVFFDDGTYTTFKVDYDGTTIGNLYVNYNDYKITFSQHPYESRINILCESEWNAESAADSNGNPLDLTSINSFNYKSIGFKDDNTCTVKLSSGETCDGSYNYNQSNEIKITLSDNTMIVLKADFDGTNINSLVLIDDDYNITYLQ